MGDIDLFWEENATYVFVYAVYAALVAGVAIIGETTWQRSDVSLAELFLSNGTQFLLAILLFSSSLYVTGWLPDLFGGELASFLVTAGISLGCLWAVSTWSFDYLEISLGHPQVVSLATSLAFLAPFVAFNAFVLALGSADWRN